MINDFINRATELIDVIDNVCLTLKNDSSGCRGCPCYNQTCLMEVATFLEEFSNIKWSSAAEKDSSNHEEFKDAVLENKILKDHLTQKVLANLEMQIALDMNKAKCVKEENNVCSEG